MASSRILLVVVLGVLVLSALSVVGGLGLGAGDGAVPELTGPLRAVLPPAQEVRRFRRFPLAAPRVLDGAQGVAQPEVVTVDPSGDLYVVDYADRSVRRLTRHGDEVWSYRGELFTPTSMEVGPGHELWIADPARPRLLVLSSESGLPVREVPLPQRPYRVLPRPGGPLTMWTPPVSRLFASLDATGAVVRQGGEMVERQAEHGLVLDGWIAPGPGSGFLYASRYLGLVAGFDGSLELQFARWWNPGAHGPTVHRNGEGRIWLGSDAAPRLRSLSSSGSRFYLLTDLAGSGAHQALDVFSAEDGTYLHSYRLPSAFSSLVVGNGVMVASRDGELQAWRVSGVL